MDAMESKNVSTKQRRIAELARIHPEVSFTSLAYHIDLEWLYEAYERTRKDGAVGVDEQTAEEYARELVGNLKSLLERAKSGSYKAPPVRRVHIPKGSSGKEKRPIGVPSFEDKVLHRAVQMVLEPLYEQDFLDCSYGFRPRRSAHDALQVLWKHLMELGGGWIIDLDICKFFDTMSHAHLREILKRRVRDGVLLRLIGKWLKAGVWEKGSVNYPEQGTPQGGVISPMLSNIYLHEALDKWFMEVVRPRMRGKAYLVRFADDAVLIFCHEEDARRVMEALPKRFGKYGFTVHPEKTRLIRFRKSGSATERKVSSSFTFLGFTHYWGRSRKGNWVVKRKTEKSRFSRALKAGAEWCKRNRHLLVKEQHKALSRKLWGHYGYYGITGNARSLQNFLYQVQRVWHKLLNRRSRGNHMLWGKFNLLLKRYPFHQSGWCILFVQRSYDTEEPDAGNPHVRVCGGFGWVTTRFYPEADHGKHRKLVIIHQ
jgi:group II intron reverse transcriptase/maturase